MRVTIEIEEELSEALRELTGATNDGESVLLALRTHVTREYRNRLLAMRGNFDIDDNWEALRMHDTLHIQES